MEDNFKEMCKSLVCILDEETVREILLGEQYTDAEIDWFIEQSER